MKQSRPASVKRRRLFHSGMPYKMEGFFAEKVKKECTFPFEDKKFYNKPVNHVKICFPFARCAVWEKSLKI